MTASFLLGLIAFFPAVDCIVALHSRGHLNSYFALQLRLNKVSELIHNSTHHLNLEMAKVSVYFQEIIDTVSKSAPE